MELYKSCLTRFNQKISNLLSNISSPLKEPMEYSVLGGGKRIRPYIVYLIGHILDTPKENLDAAACAIEMIHCYSLVHDDLPAMDDDDLRRGRLTCHKRFDEATAILTGDALLTHCFAILTDDYTNPVGFEEKVAMTQEISKHAGLSGMITGQVLDMKKPETQEQLILTHRNKTSSLFRASAQLGLIASGYIKKDINKKIDAIFDRIGLAFQIQDDILEHTSTTEELGKSNQSDVKNEKATIVTLMGLEKSEEYLKYLVDDITIKIKQLDSKWKKLFDFVELVIRGSTCKA